jgi:hypothetical protein
MFEMFNRLILRLEQLLPAGAGEEGRGLDIISTPSGLSGYVPRARLDRPQPHGAITLVLNDATRVPLPRAEFVGGTFFNTPAPGPLEPWVTRLQFRFAGDVTYDLYVRGA